MSVSTVKICPTYYNDPIDQEKYKTTFGKYNFELDHFQKYAIQAIEEGHHVLITAHTGSGKTLPSEHAIQKFCRAGKKVIYTSPIKSLSNQKFHEFTTKFPDISFGILTGDIKFNPQADCLIMTTEILRNLLFKGTDGTTNNSTINNSSSTTNNSTTNNNGNNFSIDVMTELACVVFDEIHYINDRDRGKVWEETIITLPKHIQMVMLSATIDKADAFAKWIQSTKDVTVWLTSTDIRVVPLNHYMYYNIPESYFKNVKDRNVEALLRGINGKLTPIKPHGQRFDNEAVGNMQKVVNYMDLMSMNVKHKYVLNQIVDHLNDNNMLPGICFVFSRKNVTEYANSIEKCLFNDNDKNFAQSLVEKECRHIMMKLPNYHEYINLPEYHEMVNLVKKGIAIHHSGIIPVLREMVELLFSKGFIKMLFATETFAVGVNMPTKTVLFSSLTKFDGTDFRYLLSHEYTQMAGRAGRRGIDTVGHVIHLNNMFEFPKLHEYQCILNGNPQILSSKFEIDFSLVLRLIDVTNSNLNDHTNSHTNTNENKITYMELQRFVEKSMITHEIQKEYEAVDKEIKNLESQLESQQFDDHVYELFDKYQKLLSLLPLSKNKQKKKVLQEISTMEQENPTLKTDYESTQLDNTRNDEINQKYIERENIATYVKHSLRTVLLFLNDHDHEFININNNENEENNNEIICDGSRISLTSKGKIASKIQEINCLVFSEILLNGSLDDLDVKEIVAILSAFVDLTVSEDQRINSGNNCSTSPNVCKAISDIQNVIEIYQHNCNCNTKLCFDIQDCVMDWCDVTNVEECNAVLEQIYVKGIFLGEFIKAILKINNIAHELANVCEMMEYIDLKFKLSQIPELTLKFVATNQSLYI